MKNGNNEELEIVCDENGKIIEVGLLKLFEKRDVRMLETIKKICITFAISITIIVVGLVGAFLLYLYNYDVVYEIDQTGVYTLVDSEGNVISADIEPEQAKQIMEVLNNGNTEDNER